MVAGDGAPTPQRPTTAGAICRTSRGKILTQILALITSMKLTLILIVKPLIRYAEVNPSETPRHLMSSVSIPMPAHPNPHCKSIL